VDSSYRLGVMDRDGSNARLLFPAEGEGGLEPIPPSWSPDGARLAVLYRGDLWIVDVETGLGQPLTTDGQTQAFDWSP
jgi:Tol biopolymer transport system component